MKIATTLVLVIIYGVFWIGWTGDTPVNLEKNLRISRGTSTSSLDTVLRADVAHWRYQLWRIFFAPDIELKVGNYELTEGTDTLDEVFENLENPVAVEEDITLLPGWHKAEIAAEFHKKEITGDLLTEEGALLQKLAADFPFLEGKKTLEGFLMPDTYRIAGDTDVETIVRKMLQNFDKKIYGPFLASGKPVSAFYDVLTLASIVQEEEKSATQISTVASILKKRLRSDWMLGADVTACYADLITGSECQKYINNYYSMGESARKEKNNAYDTRGFVGLPPTPIASVAAPTFFATLDATAEIPAWYYLHDSRGIIHTATTEAEHEQNKTTYLR